MSTQFVEVAELEVIPGGNPNTRTRLADLEHRRHGFQCVGIERQIRNGPGWRTVGNAVVHYDDVRSLAVALARIAAEIDGG